MQQVQQIEGLDITWLARDDTVIRGDLTGYIGVIGTVHFEFAVSAEYDRSDERYCWHNVRVNLKLPLGHSKVELAHLAYRSNNLVDRTKAVKRAAREVKSEFPGLQRKLEVINAVFSFPDTTNLVGAMPQHLIEQLRAFRSALDTL